MECFCCKRKWYIIGGLNIFGMTWYSVKNQLGDLPQNSYES